MVCIANLHCLDDDVHVYTYCAHSLRWALGCVMYEVMSLRHAFDADDMNGLVMKIVRGKV